MARTRLKHHDSGDSEDVTPRGRLASLEDRWGPGAFSGKPHSGELHCMLLGTKRVPQDAKLSTVKVSGVRRPSNSDTACDLNSETPRATPPKCV